MITLRGRGGLKIAADVWGDEGAAPVVFLHGGGQTRHAWAGAAEAVAERGFRAYVLDHRGHGDSEWSPDGDYSSQAFEDDLLALADQLPPGPTLVGASLGGLTSLGAQSRRPFARALVLVDVTPRLEVSGVLRILSFMRARPEGFASLEEAADAVAAYLPQRPRPRDLGGLQKNLRRGDDGRLRWHWDPALMAQWSDDRYDPAATTALHQARLTMARSLRVPTLLIRGRMSDVVSPEGVREFMEAAPHARFVDLAEAGHMVAGDRNDAFTRSVVDFLATLG